MCPTDAIRYSDGSECEKYIGGYHVLVDLVRLLDWEFTRPKDALPEGGGGGPWDEALLAEYFLPWEPPGRPEEQDCWHCGWPWSSRHRCPAWGVRCHRCGLPNHYARVCHTATADDRVREEIAAAASANNDDAHTDSDRQSAITDPTSPSKKRPHRKRKKTAKQKKRDQDRLQKFLEKKALEQQLIEQGLEVDEIKEILSNVASHVMVASVQETLTQQGEWDEETLKTRMDQLPEQVVMNATGSTSKEADEEEDNRMSPQRPCSVESTPKKRIVPNLDLLKNDQDVLANASGSSSEGGEALDSFTDLPTPDDLNTPEVIDDSVFEGELDWEDKRKQQKGDNSDEVPVEPIPEYTAKEEFEDEKNWRSVTVGDRQFRIDMKVIEPYKKVLSHGGYYGDGFNAIIVFAGCYLPDKRRRDYHYVMDNLFLYVLSTLELLVVEDYMVVYFHGATPKQKMPSLRWLKRCYEMIDRRLRKNLKSLLIVHPTLWIKTIMTLTKPFISSKFSSKLKYIRGLKELADAVPMEYIFVPDEIKILQNEFDEMESMSKDEKKAKKKANKRARFTRKGKFSKEQK